MPSQEFTALLSTALKGEEDVGTWRPNAEEVKYAVLTITDLLRVDPNNPHALNLCGLMHIYGQWPDSKNDDARGLLYYDRAIEGGSILAMCNRAHWYRFGGEGSEINLAAAKALYLRAIDLGSIRAMHYLGLVHIQENNFTDAITMFEQAISHGFANAMAYRAGMHEIGQGGVVNYPEAIRLYKQAVDLGNYNSMILLASMYENGKGIDVNYPEAIRLYEEAIILGDTVAMNNRAYMHQYGKGGAVNYSEAIRLYEKAIALGNTSAMFNRAFMYEKAIDCEQNLPDAVKLYSQAYILDKHGDSLMFLERLAFTKYYLNAQQLMSLIYLKEKKWDKLEQLYLLNSQKLKIFLCQEVIKRLDEVPVDEDFVQTIIDFVLEKTPTSDDDLQLNYIRFKMALLQQDTIEALTLYRRLDVINYVTAQDLFQLGHLFLDGVGGLVQKDKISRLDKACEFLYHSHTRGNKNAYPVLVKLLRDKESLENNILPVDISFNRGVDEKQEAELVNRFILKMQQKDNQSAISFFNGFIASKKYRLHKKNKEEGASKSLQLAHDVIKGLTQGFELHEVIAWPENLSRIKQRGGFFTVLNPLVESTGYNLIQLLEGVVQSAPGS